MNNHQILKCLFLIPLIASIPLAASGQKLPNKQEISVPAPDDVKVDGKPGEWNNHFQAYNRATGIFYTLANDNEKLYLTVQAKDMDVINRIVGGGITLTVQRTADKKDKSRMGITYPVTDGKTVLIFSSGRTSLDIPDTTTKAADSIMMLHNKLLAQKCKWIRVSGIEAVDTLISVYNDEGIKAAGLFDNKRFYTLEMSVLLKHLKLSALNAEKFVYNICVNGAKQGSELFGYAPASAIQANAERNARLSAPTDFWGEYALAKK